MKLLVALVCGFASAGTAVAWLTWAAGSLRFSKYLISDDPHRAIGDAALKKAAALNMVFSLALIVGSSFALQGYLFYDREVPLWRMVLEAVAVILIYDFAYYFVHRYPFHEWKLLRGVHAVHHAAQNPRVIDSFLLNPVETFLGLGLMFGSILVVGGIHIYTFLPIFIAYTTLNVFNHGGLAFRFFPLKTIGELAVKHDRHHHSMMSGNYASITPLPDYVFGTLE